MKDWSSPVYAFFKAVPQIAVIDNRRCHIFECAAPSCKGTGKKPRDVRRYLDTNDRSSTGNLRKHARLCWGNEIVEKADAAKDLAYARKEIGQLKQVDGSITAAFERVSGKGRIKYSHRQHTSAETR